MFCLLCFSLEARNINIIDQQCLYPWTSIHFCINWNQFVKDISHKFFCLGNFPCAVIHWLLFDGSLFKSTFLVLKGYLFRPTYMNVNCRYEKKNSWCQANSWVLLHVKSEKRTTTCFSFHEQAVFVGFAWS